MDRWLIVGLLCFPGVAMALQISGARVEPRAFDPARQQEAVVYFHIDKAASVSLSIYDDRQLLIYRADEDFKAGDHSLRWKGTTGTGDPVPAEAYLYTLTAEDETGSRVEHDLTDITGQERIANVDIQWDRQANTLSYRLPALARINIRAGIKNNGPLLNTLLSWVPRPSGLHTLSWDGWDASHSINLSNHPQLLLVANAYRLPENTILVLPLTDKSDYVAMDKVAMDQGSSIRRPKKQRQKKQIFAYWQQRAGQRGDFSVDIAVPGSEVKTGSDVNNSAVKGGPVDVNGKVPIRIDVSEENRQRAISQRFEMVVYVDGGFVFENEVGFLPMSYILDTGKLTNGEHFVSVNLRGYEGNFGMATLKINVNNSQEAGL